MIKLHSRCIIALEVLPKEREVTENETKKATKEETDRHAYFNRAAKVYLDAEKLIKQQENYGHLEEIFNMYDEAKARVEVQ